jgi:hypothetical protein
LVVWYAEAPDEASRVPEPTRDFAAHYEMLGGPHFRRGSERLLGMDGTPNMGRWKQWRVLSKLKATISEMVEY